MIKLKRSNQMSLTRDGLEKWVSELERWVNRTYPNKNTNRDKKN